MRIVEVLLDTVARCKRGHPRGRRTPYPATKSRIVLVDDYAVARHGLALVLTEEGVRKAEKASNRNDALEAAGREPPEMALVDLSLGANATAAL
jgi:ActR/RegA family two-component response regulator